MDKVINYCGVKITIADGAQLTHATLRRLAFNLWNYTRIEGVTPELNIYGDNYSFVSHGTNFGWLTNQSMVDDERYGRNQELRDAKEWIETTIRVNGAC